MKTLHHCLAPTPSCSGRGVGTHWSLLVTDAKKKRRKPKLKKPEPILLRDQSTSPCLPPTVLLPPPLPSTATTVASMVASAPPVYPMPRVFGPFPPLPSKSVSECVPHSMWSREGQPLPLCSEPPQWFSWGPQQWLLQLCF